MECVVAPVVNMHCFGRLNVPPVVQLRHVRWIQVFDLCWFRTAKDVFLVHKVRVRVRVRVRVGVRVRS